MRSREMRPIGAGALDEAVGALTFPGNFWQIRDMKAALLPDRGVLEVAGKDARKFLNGLITSDMGKVEHASACYAALLSPQGKIIVDFLVVACAPPEVERFLLDCPRSLSGALAERLAFYRLRAKINIADRSDAVGVMALWNGAQGAALAVWDGAAGAAFGAPYVDPRLPELGWRCMAAPKAAAAAAAFGAELTDAAAYEAHRIALGVPSGGLDFPYGDTFPHEADMDQLNGVDFRKGCFVGQEVVSRMEHRGSARTRVVPVAFGGPPPTAGSAVTAGDKPVGTMGSTAAGRGLALLRLDRVEEALAAGKSLVADGIQLRLSKPAWARFTFPGEVKAEP
jgi:folate-binding protein YgfZ